MASSSVLWETALATRLQNTGRERGCWKEEEQGVTLHCHQEGSRLRSHLAAWEMSSHREKCGAVLQTQPFPLLQQTVTDCKPLMHIQDMVRYPFSPLDYELCISLFSYPENNPNNVSLSLVAFTLSRITVSKNQLLFLGIAWCRPYAVPCLLESKKKMSRAVLEVSSQC